jgi:hypothetical protein
MRAASPIKIFCGGAMRPLMGQAIALFERSNAVTIDIEFRLTLGPEKSDRGWRLIRYSSLSAPGARRAGRVRRDSELARAFIAFMATAETKRLIRAAGLVRARLMRAEFRCRWAETLAPSRFYAHIGLTWGGSADTYPPLFGRR